MVTLRKLNAEETAYAFPKRGQIDVSEYIEALQHMTPGETAEIETNGISRRALKRRVGQAAKQLGVSIKWSRLSDDESMIFQLRAAGATRATRNGTRRTRRTNKVLVEA